MKYEYLQLVIQIKDPNWIYAFLGESDGKAIICSTHYDDEITNRMNTILLVPFEEIEIAEDYGIAETNQMQSSFPMDVFVGSLIADFSGKFYRVLAIQPIFFPRQNECKLLVQNSKHRTSVISWAYMEFSVGVNNEFYQQNLNTDRYFIPTSTEIYKVEGISAELMKPTDFVFDLNTLVPQIYLRDSKAEKYMHGMDIGHIQEDPMLELVAYCYESEYSGMNEIRIHVNTLHEKCNIDNKLHELECDTSILSTPSGSFIIEHNGQDFLSLNSGEEVTVTIHKVESENDEGFVQYIDIYLSNILKEQFII